MSTLYNIVAESDKSTVVAHYEQRADVVNDYQSEADLEEELMNQLERQGYGRPRIHTEAELIGNLRHELERLNHYQFTDREWDTFFRSEIAKAGSGIEEKTKTVQSDRVKVLRRDNGEQKNIYLLREDDIHANSTQVIHQYVPEGGSRENRYDVTILVNGLPLVHIELKRRGKNIREAFNQINRYERESFWAGSGLFDYVQIFVISNGTQTKYYSNTTRRGHISEQGRAARRPRVKTSNSFEFTSFWADATNKALTDLRDFTATFFTRHTLLNILLRYCVFTTDKSLMVMRPYQIAAAERVLNKIETAHNSRRFGTRDAGGYVWHSTGSGKTLTSFKVAQLASGLTGVEKVLFVVDRKDLDYQTIREYDRFQRGAANGSSSTKILAEQLADTKSKILVTTIQKLSSYVKHTPSSPVYDKEVVLIFDECHRSQFGEMHAAITKKFKKYYLFGFTGTPIFPENHLAANHICRTTDDLFGERLHTYTIVDAIRDRNVLPFRIAYISTIKGKEEIENSKVWDIQRDAALRDPKRIEKVTKYVLDNFGQQTKRSESYYIRRQKMSMNLPNTPSEPKAEETEKVRVNGFNSIMAVQSIECARLYYDEFRRQMELLPENKRLKLATIFSFAPNEAEQEGAADEDCGSTDGLDQSSRDFLDRAIADYNQMFGTQYDTSSERFGNYYKDVSRRMKQRELDLLIVVNMFLTGFDATTVNTLWVDKNLRYHGLLQAFSRTNRILNAVKVMGNIVCFRNLEDATNRALALFGDKDANGTSLMRPFEDYFNGYTDKDGTHVKGYKELVEELQKLCRPGEIPVTDEEKRRFIRLMGQVLRMRNLLSSFEKFPEKDPLPQGNLQDYTSVYLYLKEHIPKPDVDKAYINDDLVFETELVKQIEVNIDYILYLVEQYHQKHDEETLRNIRKCIDASPDLRDKRELIMRFVSSLTPDSDVYERWEEYVKQEKERDFQQIISEEQLNETEALRFIRNAFLIGYVKEGGTELESILPPIDPFDKRADRSGKRQTVLERIKAFFSKFFDISHGNY